MLTPLADPSPTLYVLLVLLAAVAGGLLARWQSRGSLIRFGAAVALLAGLFLCDTLAESPREEAVRRIGLITAAINRRDTAGFLAEVSDRFEFNGKKKADFIPDRLMAAVRQHNVTASTSGYDRDKVVYQDWNSTPAVVIAFDGLASTPDGPRLPRHFTARFVRDPDGAYRMQTFTPFNYIQKGVEEPIPQL